jgi:hypothetical protein
MRIAAFSAHRFNSASSGVNRKNSKSRLLISSSPVLFAPSFLLPRFLRLSAITSHYFTRWIVPLLVSTRVRHFPARTREGKRMSRKTMRERNNRKRAVWRDHFATYMAARRPLARQTFLGTSASDFRRSTREEGPSKMPLSDLTAKSLHMIHRFRLFVLVVFFTSVALADDFKTINGKEYKNAKLSRVEPDGIVIVSLCRTATATSTILTPEQAIKLAIYTPQPVYPLYARSRYITGDGDFRLRIQIRTGLVKNVKIARSTGWSILGRSLAW